MITDTAVSARVDDALAAVRAEVARTDTKASLLLALTGTLLAGVAAGADIALPTPARLAGSVAGLLLVAAVLRLLLVVRPCLPKDGGDRASFPYWSRCTTSQLAASLEEDRRLHQIAVLSGIACDAEIAEGEQCMTEDSPPGNPQSATEARKRLHRQGWRRTRDGRDICPDCWAQGRR